MTHLWKYGLIALIVCFFSFTLFIVIGLVISSVTFTTELTDWIILILIYGILEIMSLIFGILALIHERQRILGIFSIIIAGIVLLMVLPAMAFLYLPNL
jgi:hypothetical protein